MKFLKKLNPKLILLGSMIKKNLALIAILIIASNIIIFDFSHKYWNIPTRVISSDVKSYYAYLPAAFIYKDLSLGFTKTDSKKFKPYIWSLDSPNGKKAIVTTMGVAITYSPFFLIAHAITPYTSFEADGFTTPYKFALMMSCLFYLIIGLVFLKKILEQYFNQYIVAITLFSIVMGTNLFMYTTHHQAPMSHVYSFSLINIFLYYVIKWVEKITYKNTIIIGLTAGLIALIRPTNILILLILFFYNIRSFKDIGHRIVFFGQEYKKVLLMAFLFFVVWIPQLIYWKYISGHYFFFTYKELLGEGFFFNNPQITSLLFSYKKGWLLYTPIMIFALLGIPILYFKLRQFFIAIAVYIFIMIYVLASWWCWWYGGSFGMRSAIDFYGVLAIPFAAFLNYSFRWKKIAGVLVITIVGVLIWFNTFQSRQYVNQTIHWAWMTKDAYWNTFLQPYPKQGYRSLLREYDIELAKKGIYVELEPAYYQKPAAEIEEHLSREERIKEIETRIRASKPLLRLLEEKADKRGVSLDSMIILDATWLYDKELKGEY